MNLRKGRGRRREKEVNLWEIKRGKVNEKGHWKPKPTNLEGVLGGGDPQVKIKAKRGKPLSIKKEK